MSRFARLGFTGVPSLSKGNAMLSVTPHLHEKFSTPLIRIGLDMDNTLMSNDRIWAYEFAHTPCVSDVQHPPVPETAISETYDYFREICTPCLERCLVDPRVLLAHDPMPGALETVRDLYAKGAEFHVISARPDQAYDATVEWLVVNGFYEYISSVTLTHAKRKVCEDLNLDVIIDDSHYVYDDMHRPTKSKTRLLFMHATHNKNHPATERYHDWEAIHQELLQMLPR